MGIEWGRNLRKLLSIINGHVDKLLFPVAFRSVLVVGITINWCRKVRVSLMVPSGVNAFICGSPFGMYGWCLDALGNLHILVVGSLYSVKILRPPFYTFTCCFVNFTSHLLLHITGIETRLSFVFLGLYAFFAFSGRPFIFIWYWMCASILFLSSRCALICFMCWS